MDWQLTIIMVAAIGAETIIFVSLWKSFRSHPYIRALIAFLYSAAIVILLYMILFFTSFATLD
jgi:hypothetical protein